MHANATVECHRHLGHFGHDRAERGVQRHAAGTRSAIGRRRDGCPPATFLGGELQHAQRPRMRLQHGGAVRCRVLCGRGREFVDEALHEKRLMRVADTAPRAHGDRTLGFTVRRVQRGKGIGLIPRAFARRAIGSRLREQKAHPLAVRLEGHLPGRMRHEGGHVSVGVERGAQSRDGGRTIEIMPHVVFARPDHLHRHARRRFGDRRRLGDVVHIEPPAKAAAKDVLMHRDLVLVEIKHMRHGRACVARHLRTGPQFGTLVRHAHGGVHRFHRGVREVRRFVRRVDGACRFPEGLLRPAVEAHRHAVVVAHGVADVLHHRHGGDCGLVRAGHRGGQRVRCVACLPPRLRDHRQRCRIAVLAAGQRDHRAHARHGATVLHLRIGDRRRRRRAEWAHHDRRIKHVGQRHIDAKGGRAVRLGH